MAKVVILSGSNSGRREIFLKDALKSVIVEIGNVVMQSGLYSSEPWGFEAEQDFLNQVFVCETNLSPEAVLHSLLKIEKDLGRTRSNDGNYSSRTIDLDILYYDDRIIESEKLTVPHPRLQDRNFVLQPLAEILPDWIHPILKLSNQQLLSQSPDQGIVQKVN